MNYYRAIKKNYPDIRDDQFLLQDDGEGVFLAKWNYSDSKPSLSDLEELAESEEALAKWENTRRNAYPDIRDQLDMLYHDLKNSTNTWEQAIDKVKSDYPKPIR